MGPELFLLICLLAMILAVLLSGVIDNLETQRAWKGPQRFTVRQIEDRTQREWVCARYRISDGKIYFLQEGQKEQTVVAGQWHVEPFTIAR